LSHADGILSFLVRQQLTLGVDEQHLSAFCPVPVGAWTVWDRDRNEGRTVMIG
jgi:hypothetical protein